MKGVVHHMTLKEFARLVKRETTVQERGQIGEILTQLIKTKEAARAAAAEKVKTAINSGHILMAENIVSTQKKDAADLSELRIARCILTGDCWDMPVSELGIPARAEQALTMRTITHVDEIANLGKDRLRSIPGLTDESFTTIVSAMEDLEIWSTQ